MKLLGGYALGLVLLGLWGGARVWAGDTTGAMAPEIISQTPMGPVMLDLGNLTLPGALVIIAYLFRGGIPIRIHHTHDKAE